MNFGNAIEALKEGKRVARKGWNGKGMFLLYVSSLEWDMDFDVTLWSRNKSPFIAMKTADCKVVPWVASQTDMLSEDWVVIG